MTIATTSIRKYPDDRLVPHTKFSSQPLIRYQAAGNAINKANPISSKNQLLTSISKCGTEAPITLRMPISLILVSTMKPSMPMSPKHEIIPVVTENNLNEVLSLCSLVYCCSNSS